jgi:hypothetical protein
MTVDDAVAADGSYGYDEERALIFLVESGGELYMVRLLFVSAYEGGDEIGKVGVHRMDFATCVTLAAVRFLCPGSISARRARVTTMGCFWIASTSSVLGPTPCRCLMCTNSTKLPW